MLLSLTLALLAAQAQQSQAASSAAECARIFADAKADKSDCTSMAKGERNLRALTKAIIAQGKPISSTDLLISFEQTFKQFNDVTNYDPEYLQLLSLAAQGFSLNPRQSDADLFQIRIRNIDAKGRMSLYESFKQARANGTLIADRFASNEADRQDSLERAEKNFLAWQDNEAVKGHEAELKHFVSPNYKLAKDRETFDPELGEFIFQGLRAAAGYANPAAYIKSLKILLSHVNVEAQKNQKWKEVATHGTLSEYGDWAFNRGAIFRGAANPEIRSQIVDLLCQPGNDARFSALTSTDNLFFELSKQVGPKQQEQITKAIIGNYALDKDVASEVSIWIGSGASRVFVLLNGMKHSPSAQAVVAQVKQGQQQDRALQAIRVAYLRDYAGKSPLFDSTVENYVREANAEVRKSVLSIHPSALVQSHELLVLLAQQMAAIKGGENDSSDSFLRYPFLMASKRELDEFVVDDKEGFRVLMQVYLPQIKHLLETRQYTEYYDIASLFTSMIRQGALDKAGLSSVVQQLSELSQNQQYLTTFKESEYRGTGVKFMVSIVAALNDSVEGRAALSSQGGALYANLASAMVRVPEESYAFRGNRAKPPRALLDELLKRLPEQFTPTPKGRYPEWMAVVGTYHPGSVKPMLRLLEQVRGSGFSAEQKKNIANSISYNFVELCELHPEVKEEVLASPLVEENHKQRIRKLLF